jgi:hypothetical protein
VGGGAYFIVALNAQFLAQFGKTEFENIPNRPELRGSFRASLSAQSGPEGLCLKCNVCIVSIVA